MKYSPDFTISCQKDINKATKKNPLLKKAIWKKIQEVLKDPYHYKPLRHPLEGERRVHIMKSFVLKFIIEENNKKVIFIFFGHHDVAYKK